MKYKVHQFYLKMTTDQRAREHFLNGAEGELVAADPNITVSFFWSHRVDSLLVVERVA